LAFGEILAFVHVDLALLLVGHSWCIHVVARAPMPGRWLRNPGTPRIRGQYT
jgi:hypothetical protein